MKIKKRILVAPLNWGLGHATRCIPIINALITSGFQPIIASDGMALSLLQHEFPDLEHIELPGYNIEYAKNGRNFKLKMIGEIPKIKKAIHAEKRMTQSIVTEYEIDGIISDNRFGVQSSIVPSVFITHQLKVLSGNTTWLSSKIHNTIINQFDACWVPDFSGSLNLSGKLGHDVDLKIPVSYIGPLSRFEKKQTSKKYDILVLLSGPEPQRSMLENLMLNAIKPFNGTILFIRGIVETKQKIDNENNCHTYNFMTSHELEKAFNESDLIISRSGYTTIMDLAKLEKKAFFIPTPGQLEQQYLAEKLMAAQSAPYCQQDEFTLDKLKQITKYSGLKGVDHSPLNYNQLFSFFERK